MSYTEVSTISSPQPTRDHLFDVKEQVRQATDIVDLVGGFIPLRRQGRNFVGLCPWHDDSRPSLQVNPERQSFKCWVCDIGGDVFSFLMKMEGLEFREALETLAERAGIPLRPIGKPDGIDGTSDTTFNKKTLLAAVAWAEEQFHRCLLDAPEAADARDYLADRDITKESVDRFRIGFAPPGWDWLLRRVTEEETQVMKLAAAGLAIERAGGGGFYDRFRGRVMFPIRDVQGRPIAFGGRVLPKLARDDDAKYINSPESPLFSKSAQLYGLDVAKDGIGRPGKPDSVAIVMEGYTDCIMAHQHGISNAVAVLGTALTERHIPLLRRYADTVLLVLDGDEAGQRRANEVLDLFVAHQIDLRILTLPRDLDPCDFIASQGGGAFRELLSEAVDALEHKIRTVTKGMVAATATHQSNIAVESILDTLSRAPQPSHGASSAAVLREQQVLSRLAREFQVQESTLRSRLRVMRHGRHRAPRYDGPSEAGEPLAEPSLLGTQPLDPWDREVIELLLYSSDACAEILAAVSLDDLRSEPGRAMYSLFHDIQEKRGTPNFGDVMLATEDAALKSLLVSMNEESREKHGSDLDQRLHDLLVGLTKRQRDATSKEHMAALQQGQLDEQSEEATLAQLFQVQSQIQRSQDKDTHTAEDQ